MLVAREAAAECGLVCGAAPGRCRPGVRLQEQELPGSPAGSQLVISTNIRNNSYCPENSLKAPILLLVESTY